MEDIHVTYRELHAILDSIKRRIGRLEIAVAVLTVATASPKLGGPSFGDIVAHLVRWVA